MFSQFFFNSTSSLYFVISFYSATLILQVKYETVCLMNALNSYFIKCCKILNQSKNVNIWCQ